MLLRQRHAGHRPEAGEWQRLCSGFSVDEGRADSLSMDGSAKLSVDVADGSSDKEHNGQKEEDIDAEQPLPDAESSCWCWRSCHLSEELEEDLQPVHCEICLWICQAD